MCDVTTTLNQLPQHYHVQRRLKHPVSWTTISRHSSLGGAMDYAIDSPIYALRIIDARNGNVVHTGPFVQSTD